MSRGGWIASGVLALIVLACLLAPIYARLVSGTDPFRSNPSGTVAGSPVLAEDAGLGVTPIGPGWRGAYLLGADQLGRDVAARLLYGGRNSLLIAGVATALCLALALGAGVAAGFLGGAIDAGLSALLDLLWAFPVYLLAISLAIVLISEGVRLGPVTIEADSLMLPILILGLVYVPYVARPIRAEVVALRKGELVQAAVATGGSRAHILRRHLLPLVWPTLIAFAPIVAAMTLLTEAALSVLGIGVQPPEASWGTLIADGQTLIYTRPWVALAPGLAIVATVLALNVVGEAAQVRRA
ncbi:MAG: ABC transporter permease [Acetobacteraceae bacterium]|nr:ABC transporter permease [Acetobacteraceae bacterium]